MLILLAFQYPGLAVAGYSSPTWTVPIQITSDDGYAYLDWALPEGETAEFFKITETFNGKESIHYTETTGLRAWRVKPGEYSFVLNACAKNNTGTPDCGSHSDTLILQVTDAVTSTLLTEASTEITPDGTVASTDGGPEQLLPGHWHNPAKDGHGWSFYWSNRLALPQNDPLFGNSYDLVGIWYTYEAKSALSEPGCPSCPPDTRAYRPVVLKLKAVSTGTDTFGGSLYVSRNDGSEIWVGSADIVFGSNNDSATLFWRANFKKERLSDTDSLTFLHGSDSTDTTNISHFSGTWQRSGDNRYFVVTNIGETAEVITVVFHDDAGDPTWVQAVNSGLPISGNTNFCLAYLYEGYSPKLNTPVGWSRYWYMSGCNSASPADSSNRNGRRYFSGLDSEYFWANFTLPGNSFASGSISIGTSSSAIALEKTASFHGVTYNSTTGSSCELTGVSASCEVQLTWYTDGNYPGATVYAHNISTNTYDKVLTSTQPAMVDIPYQISAAGEYEFELHMGNGVQTTLIARSPNFTVTENLNSPPTIAAVGDQNVVPGASYALLIAVDDIDNDPLTCSDNGTLPAGLTVMFNAANSGCGISGSIQVGAGSYISEITVTDGNGGAASTPINWNVLSLGGNPEDPPAPVPSPDMTANSSSSMVGATAGEFRVDESGSATYSIPVLTAPASGGFSPQISLNYSSQAGNGDVGVGWSLGGVSAIARCPQTMEQDGISGSRGVGLDGGDRFCLDGQRLLVDPSSGTYGRHGTRYRTEIDSFTRITSYGSAGNGPAWFKVERKDGSVVEYGNSADSRIEARGSNTPTTVFVWTQNRLEDRSGNYILYSYLENSSGPVAYVLKAIDYTGNSRAGTSPGARLTFTYSDRSSATDLAYSYFAGVQLEQRHLLQSIRSQGRKQAGNPLEDLRFYALAYEDDGLGRNIPAALTECRSASRTICYQPTRFDWLKSESTIDTASTVLDGLLPKSTLSGLLLGDVSGDGRPDLLYTKTKSRRHYLHVKEATASAGFNEWAVNYQLPKRSDGNAPRVFAIDINSDGISDVVYSKYSKTSSDYTWVALVSNGSGFSAEIELNPSHRFFLNGPAMESRFRIMDFNGDGLSDILHAHTTAVGKSWKLTVLLNATLAGGSPVLSAPIEVDVDNADLFPESLSGGWELSTHPPFFNWTVSDADKSDMPDARIFDFNGDGAVDLLLKVWRSYKKCVSNCVFQAAVSGGGSNGGSNTDPVYEVVFASFWILMESNGQNAFTRHAIVALGENCSALEICDAPQYEHLPRSKYVWPVDINADGLADLAWGDAGSNWYFQINTGNGYASARLIGQVPDGINKLVKFEDWNGDGYPDLIYPSDTLNANAKWMLYQNHFGRIFAASSNTQVPAGNVGGDSDVDKVQNDSSVFADFNGDGKTDLLSIDNNKRGEIVSVQIRKGMNVSGSRLAEPANVITAITNGQGMKTEINYKPLTDSGVYSRMHDSVNAVWGNGAVVYDFTAPVYVVSEASSSAPVYNNISAMSWVQYHYVGAKIQAGGRGYLGFGEVISYDPQSQIRTNTRYRQDFPFIGMPLDTTQVSSAAGSRFGSVSDTATDVPDNWGSVSSSTSFPSSVSGTRLSYALNQWRSKSTAGGAVFPYVSNSIEISYTLDGSFDRKVMTSNKYDAYGNLSSSSASTYATNGSTVFARKSVTNTYADNLSKWFLGRLATSKVTHSRTGKPSITRSSSFAYDSTTSILVQEVIEPGSSVYRVTTNYQLDSFGNRTQTRVIGVNTTARTATVRYDNLGRFVIESKNALNQVTQRVSSWDVFGNPLSMVNIDGVKTTSAADHMGRPFASYTETGVWSKTINYNGSGSECPAGTVFRTITTSGGAPTQVSCFDLLGRPSGAAVRGLSGAYARTDKYYDSSGRVARVSEPYFVGQTAYWNLTAYDDLGRITAVLSAGGDDVTQDYDNDAGRACTAAGTRVTLTINGLNQQRVEIKNALGETEAVYDDECGLVSYDYDAVGNLTKVTGADGEIVTMTYDLAGRKTAMNDPDKGYWQYSYNSLGEMRRQLDSKNQAIDFTYDALGRVTDRRELKNVSSLSDAAFTTVNRETTSYKTTSPGKSQSSSVTYRSGELGAILHKKAFIYDSFGRLDLTSTTIGTEQFVEQITYDQYSRVFQQFDASGDDRGLRYIYLNGYLSELREAREGLSGKIYQHIQAMDARGNVTTMQLGNGVDAHASYEPASGKLIKLSAYDASGVELMEVDYLFDVLGNLKNRHDFSVGTNLKEVFAYDALNRLKSVGLSVNAGASAQTLSLNYDASGSVTYKSDVGSYLYNGSRPHAVSSAGGINYSYDANGNQVSGHGRTITYTVFDKPDGITRGTNEVDFSYGVGNSRYQRQDYEGTVLQKSTLYLGAVERITENGSTLFKRYLAGVAIATYYPASGVQQLSYLLKDHIGSIHSVLDESGLITATMHFNAFGERTSTDWRTPLTSFVYSALNDITTRGYTGHEQVDSVGIIHMNGRIYDPKLGRFLQADPIVQAPKNSQSLNRYSYALNNPLSFTDPSGFFSLSKFVKKWGRLIVAAVATYFTAGAASGWAAGWGLAAGTAGNAAIAGAIAGAAGGAILTGTVKGAFFGALTGAALGAIGATGWSSASKTIASGTAGGITSELQGGKFGHGFLSAGAGFWTSLKFGGPPSFGKFLAAATAGGTISELTGGKFANGAITAGLAYAMADGARSSGEEGEWIFPEGRSTDLNNYDTVITNGILGDRKTVALSVNHLQVPAYFNPSHGFFADLWESLNQKLFGSNDALARGFARGLAGVDHPMTIVAKSQGTLTVTNAARHYGLPKGSSFVLNSPALTRNGASRAIGINGGTMKYVQPWGDGANIWAPSLNPLRFLSGFRDLTCGFCIHSANGTP